MGEDRSLTVRYPGIAAQWHPNRNSGLTPEQVVPGSNKKVWWRCAEGHEWQAQVVKRIKGHGCPYCSNHRILLGYNDLLTTDPTLAAQWHPSKNGELTPEKVTRGVSKKVWWVCANGHEWQASIGSRSKGLGCPYCANKKVLAGYNDLQTTDPILASQWDPQRNGARKPTDVTLHSRVRVWWRCAKAHVWEETVDVRARGVGCPVCSNRRVLTGYNDLQTTNPALAAQWNYEKNGILKPEMVWQGSRRRVWWKCAKGHEWEASLLSRIKAGGCPMCMRYRKTSFAEKAVFYYLRQKLPDAVCNVGSKELPWLGRMELDIYIPSLQAAVEYDGPRHALKKDQRKNDLCAGNGITLFRIRNSRLPEGLKGSVNFLRRDETDAGLTAAIEELWQSISNTYTVSPNMKVDLEKDRIHIYQLLELQECENSLVPRFPEIAAQWHPVKNGSLQPEMFASKSNKTVWWKCEKDHEWRAAINSRTSGTGCPYCSNKRVLQGYNDLKTTDRALAEQWHPTKNEGLTPEKVTRGSPKKVWWKCPAGHVWRASVMNRIRSTGCPYCSNKRVLTGFNDLRSTNPILAGEWHPVKNEMQTPETVVGGSHVMVWWKCGKGHEWQATVVSRVRGNGCPYCAGLKVSVGQNDLKTVNPALSAQWHPVKNGTLTPEMVTRGTHRKVWWHCEKGHEWQANIGSRGSGIGCPYCANQRVLPGFNDLQTTDPALAAQWHPEKNVALHPEEVIRGTHRKVWWQCGKGHEWEASIASRSSGGGCPVCSNKKVLVGYNDLQTVNPQLAGQWHSELNGDFHPTDITAHSGKKAWWKCSRGHVWQAYVNNRSKGVGCPVCSRECRKSRSGKR